MLFRSRKAEALDLQKQELEGKVERRLAEVEKNHQKMFDEKFKVIKDLELKETEAQKTIEDAEKRFLAEQETALALRERAKLDGQKVAGLEESLKLKEEELSLLKARHLELEKDRSRVSSELTEFSRRAEEGFKGVAAASADVAKRVLQLDRTAELSGLAPACQSLPNMAEFL